MSEDGEACAFCGAAGEDADVRAQERLGVVVVVCAACRERFSGGGTPAPRRVVTEAPGLPPTLGQQATGVLAHVQRMARLVASRTWTEEDCAECGHPVHVHRGADGEPVRLDKDSVLATSVPAHERWRVVDDVAVPVPDLDEDDEESVGARVLHAVVCPAQPAPANPRLARMWHAHLRRPVRD